MKKLLLVVFALLLFASPIIESSLHKANAATISEEKLQSYSLYSDGRGSSPSILWDGAKFTLTRNVEGTITLMNDSIVLDGAGFTLKGDGDSIGIAAYDKTAVTIKNVKTENFQIGILLGHYSPDAFLWYDPNPNRPTNCSINDCVISNNTKGIFIAGGIKCRIIANQILNNEYGIDFFGSENIFRNNHMENNTISFADSTYENSDVDSSNTINGKPIYYLVNQQNITVPEDASMVHLEDCNNILVPNLEIRHTHKAISLFNSSNCKIYGNKLSDNVIGISLRNSSNNSIIGNKLLNNSNDAIEQYDSENTTITNNLIQANGGGIDSSGYSSAGSVNANISSNIIIANSGCGIQAGTKCTITGNYIEGNGQYGIYFWDISNSNVNKNNITKNGDCGIGFRNGNNVSITGNDISKNKVGLEMGMGDLYGCTITENNIAQNNNFAIIIYSDIKDSHFYLNNFIDNNNGSVQVSIKGRFVWKGDEGYDENSKVFPQYVASHNEWDNGTIGNYWSDHNLNLQGEPYIVDKNNQDHNPLLTPIEFSALELPSTEVSQQLSGVPQSQEKESASFPTVLFLSLVLPVIAIVTALFTYKKLKKQ